MCHRPYKYTPSQLSLYLELELILASVVEIVATKVGILSNNVEIVATKVRTSRNDAEQDINQTYNVIHNNK